MSPPSVCLVTTGQPSTNPRLVKEADALAAAGYRVRVVATAFAPWAVAADKTFLDRPWAPWSVVPFGQYVTAATGIWLRARRAVACRLVERASLQHTLALRALHYIVPELMRAAAAVPADLFVAHNLAALPAAAHAATRHGALLGFDAEDFHRGELPDEEHASLVARLTRWTEERFIPRCDYVTAASDGIADAYADVLGIPRPAVIHNVFSLSDRAESLSDAEREAEVPTGVRSLYWFSQTIGTGRGLEDAVEALALLPDDVVLSLRGTWAEGYRDVLQTRAIQVGVENRLRWLRPTPAAQMVARASCHAVGLALEPGRNPNNRLAASNKLFTYWAGGIPAVATNTPGQGIVVAQSPEAAILIPPGEPTALAAAARTLLNELPARRIAAKSSAERLWNWEQQSAQFLSLIKGCFVKT